MDEKGKSLTQNSPTTAPEAPEGQGRLEVPHDSGEKISTSQAATSETIRALQVADNSEKPERNRKRLIFVLVVVLVLLVGAGGVWWSIVELGKNTDTVQEDGEKSKEENVVENTETEADNLVEVSIDDETVKRLYEEFYYVPELLKDEYASHNEDVLRSNTDAYRTGTVDDLSDLSLMLSFLGQPVRVEERGDDIYIQKHQIRYYDTVQARERILQKFARDVDYANFKEICKYVPNPDSGNCYRSSYDVANKLLSTFRGAATGGGPSEYDIIRHLVKAAQDEDHLYLYEAVALGSMASSDKKIYKYYHVPDDFSYDAVMDYIKQPGTTLDIPWHYYEIIVPFSEADLAKYDQFKWTFKKADDGHYVFEKLEKLKQDK